MDNKAWLCGALVLALAASAAGRAAADPAEDRRKSEELQAELDRKAAEIERLKAKLKTVEDERSPVLIKRLLKGRVSVVQKTWAEAEDENIVIVRSEEEKNLVETLLAGVTAPGLEGEVKPVLPYPTRVVSSKEYQALMDGKVKGGWATENHIRSNKKNMKSDLGWNFALVYRYRKGLTGPKAR